MTIATTDLLGSDQVGVYLARVGNVLFHPLELEPSSIELLDATLGLERCPISIGGSNLVGRSSPATAGAWRWPTSCQTATSMR